MKRQVFGKHCPMGKPNKKTEVLQMKNSKGKVIARIGITGAFYVLTTVVFAPISFGMVQFRISEALSVLPLIFPECAVGLIIGCLISNLLFSTPLDVLVGTLATAIASGITAYVGLKIKRTSLKLILGEIPPILINAMLVPLTFLVLTDGVIGYLINVATVFIGQLVVISILGTLIYFPLEKIKNLTL